MKFIIIVVNILLILQHVFIVESSKNTSYLYKSFQTGIHCYSKEPIVYPKTIKDVQTIVKNAIVAGRTVKAIGSLHSATDVICTEGIPVSLKYIAYALRNKDGSTTFGAGMKLHDALTFLEKQGQTLLLVPAYSGITLGGAFGTGAHASSLKHPGMLSDWIKRLTIVDGCGNLKNVKDDEELKSFRVNLGLLGIVVEVIFKTVPLMLATMRNVLVKENVLFDSTVLQEAKNHDIFAIWWFPSSRNVVYSTGNFSKDVNQTQNYYTTLVGKTSPEKATRISNLFEFLHRTKNLAGLQAAETFLEMTMLNRVVGIKPLYTNGKDDLHVDFTKKVSGISWRMLSNKCGSICYWDEKAESPMFWEETAIACDLIEFPKVMNMIKEVLKTEAAAFYMSRIFIRFLLPSEALLALTRGNESAFVVEYLSSIRKDRYNDGKVGLAAYQLIAQEMVANHGGRPHWEKNGLYFHNQENLQNTLNRKEFIAAMKKYDPNGTFLNKFGRRLLGLYDEMDVDPQVHRCAIQMYCMCKKDKDCGVGQKCATRRGFNICKDDENSDNILQLGAQQIGNMFSRLMQPVVRQLAGAEIVVKMFS